MLWLITTPIGFVLGIIVTIVNFFAPFLGWLFFIGIVLHVGTQAP
jgi:hypothetical protein